MLATFSGGQAVLGLFDREDNTWEWCSDQYCRRYQAGSRGKGEVKSAANNLDFQCLKDVEQETTSR